MKYIGVWLLAFVGLILVSVGLDLDVNPAFNAFGGRFMTLVTVLCIGWYFKDRNRNKKADYASAPVSPARLPRLRGVFRLSPDNRKTIRINLPAALILLGAA